MDNLTLHRPLPNASDSNRRRDDGQGLHSPANNTQNTQHFNSLSRMPRDDCSSTSTFTTRKRCTPDEIGALLRLYNQQGVTNWNEYQDRLQWDGYEIKRATLGKYLKVYKVGSSRKNQMTHDEMKPVILAELDQPRSRRRGLKTVHKNLGANGYHFSRDIVEKIMKEVNPAGFEERRPKRKTPPTSGTVHSAPAVSLAPDSSVSPLSPGTVAYLPRHGDMSKQSLPFAPNALHGLRYPIQPAASAGIASDNVFEENSSNASNETPHGRFDQDMEADYDSPGYKDRKIRTAPTNRTNLQIQLEDLDMPVAIPHSCDLPSLSDPIPKLAEMDVQRRPGGATIPAVVPHSGLTDSSQPPTNSIPSHGWSTWEHLMQISGVTSGETVRLVADSGRSGSSTPYTRSAIAARRKSFKTPNPSAYGSLADPTRSLKTVREAPKPAEDGMKISQIQRLYIQNTVKVHLPQSAEWASIALDVSPETSHRNTFPVSDTRTVISTEDKRHVDRLSRYTSTLNRGF